MKRLTYVRLRVKAALVALREWLEEKKEYLENRLRNIEEAEKMKFDNIQLYNLRAPDGEAKEAYKYGISLSFVKDGEKKFFSIYLDGNETGEDIADIFEQLADSIRTRHYSD